MNEIASMIQDGALVTAGHIDHFNTMTIGWGLIGTIWRKEVLMCFVRPSRYTYEFFEKNEYFTVSFFYPSYKPQMSYLGTISGRKIDKVKEAQLTPYSMGEGVGFQEAYVNVLCKKIYFQDMDFDTFPQDVKQIYYSSGDVHRLYMGEIVAIEEQK